MSSSVSVEEKASAILEEVDDVMHAADKIASDIDTATGHTIPALSAAEHIIEFAEEIIEDVEEVVETIIGKVAAPSPAK